MSYFKIYYQTTSLFQQEFRKDPYINNVAIDRTKQIKFLGYIIDEKLSWNSHINYISLKVSKNIAIIKKLITTINRDSLYNLYYSLIYPYLINGITVWGTSGITYK